MYKISVFEDGTLRDVFHTDVYLDQTVETFEISVQDFQRIQNNSDFGCWKLLDGILIESAPTTL